MAKRIRRFLCLVCALAALFCAAPTAAAADSPALSSARFVWCYSLENDKLLYAENEEKPLYPASTAKIMTGILAIEHYDGAYDTVITITDEIISLSGGTKISYKEGEKVTAEQLLYGLIVGNGNDAAYALAISVGGSVDGFVRLMNEKAAAIGTKNTHYTNPTGTDDTRAYTTAADVGLIALYASKNEKYVSISSCEKYHMEPTNTTDERTIANKNYLVSESYLSTYYLSYATGLNAGSTVKGGSCCVGLATKDGITVIAVVMNVPEKENDKTVYSFADAKKLIEWAYKSYAYQKVLNRNDIVCEIKVKNSSQADYVALLPKDDLLIYLPTDADIRTDVKREYQLESDSITAPVKSGTEVGIMKLYYQEECVGEIPLVTKNDVDRSLFMVVGGALKKTFFNMWTLIAAALLIAFAVLCIFINAYNRGRKNRRQ